jgi:hypothetical protein
MKTCKKCGFEFGDKRDINKHEHICNDEIIAYARRDKRTSHGILMCDGKPRWIVRPSSIKKYNIDDFIPLTKETISDRGETALFRSWGFDI